MDALLQVVAVIVVVIYALIIALARLRYQIAGKRLIWLISIAVMGALTSSAYLIPAEQSLNGNGRSILLIAAIIGIIGTTGGIIIDDITAPDKRLRRLQFWTSIIVVWLVAFLASVLLGSTAIAGQPEWLIRIFREIDASAIVTIIGYGVAAFVLIAYTFWFFLKTALPEIANRALFWMSSSMLLLFASLITASGTDIVALFGLPALALKTFGIAYALGHHHIFDVRAAIFNGIRVVSFVLLGTILTTVVFVVALDVEAETTAERTALAVASALIVALLYVPLRYLTTNLFRRFTQRHPADSTQITREYSQGIAEAIEFDTLINTSNEALTRLFDVHSSCVILLNQTFEDSISLLVMQANDPTSRRSGRLSVKGELYHVLAREQKPLLQFDIEFDPRYQKASPNERDFFRSLGMSAYAPITLDHAMIGILALGPKRNDTAFYNSDLDLLVTLAQQTGIALRNARFVEDLQHLNTSMRNLNRKLKTTNDQLSQMDSVKSDFVTIASHELRTPLAQIRGYTDIMDALNEQGLLDPDQTNTLIANLRKATERVEELIAAMLDVSQLDVDAMDLRFAPTSIESVVKMAIEPLTDAIRQRKLTLSARGLRGLPNLQADLQRLVQAVRNVIVNAIKFTPDGGKIEIIASLHEATNENEADHVRIQIKDSGVGIDKVNLEMIFKKFFRAYDPSLHSTGTYKFLGAGPGLGLTITRGVIEGHGGRIWAESPGHDMEQYPGATFNIILPVTTPEGARRVLTFQGTAANEAIGRTAEMDKNTAMRRPNGESNSPQRATEEFQGVEEERM